MALEISKQTIGIKKRLACCLLWYTRASVQAGIKQRTNGRCFRSLLWRLRDPWGLPASRGPWGPERQIGSPVLWPATKLGVVINCSVDSFTRFYQILSSRSPKNMSFQSPKNMSSQSPKNMSSQSPRNIRFRGGGPWPRGLRGIRWV